MAERELRRNLAVFSMGSVMRLTDLTARQIRYYEEQGLIKPERTEGNRRLYSLNDMDKLLEIKDYLAEGLNMAAIRNRYALKAEQKKKALSDAEVRRLLRDEIQSNSHFANPSPYPSQLRF